MGLEDEQRTSRRIRTTLKASIQQLGKSTQTFEEITRDLSGGGAFLETDAKAKVGDRFELVLDTREPNQDALRLQAEVVRVEGRPRAGLAIRFLDTSPEQLFQIALILEKGQKETGDMG